VWRASNLCEIQTSTISTVIIVAVHVQDLLAIYREQTREDTFGKTGTLCISLLRSIASRRAAYQNDDIVLLVHVCLCEWGLDLG
jgi:hypothetical protein